MTVGTKPDRLLLKYAELRGTLKLDEFAPGIPAASSLP